MPLLGQYALYLKDIRLSKPSLPLGQLRSEHVLALGSAPKCPGKNIFVRRTVCG